MGGFCPKKPAVSVLYICNIRLIRLQLPLNTLAIPILYNYFNCMKKSFPTIIQKYLDDNGFEKFEPKVALFDMDGVLLDSMPNHSVAWQKSMKKFGLTMTAEDAYATEGQRGVDTIRIMVKEQLGKDISEAEAQEMYDEKTHEFGLMPTAKIMRGVKPLMRKMQKSGLRIGVVTGSGQRPLIKRILEDFKGLVDEDKVVTAYDVKRGKPAPDPYLMGLEMFGDMKPWNAIVVENAPLGVRAGVAAKIFTVGVNTGPLPDEALANEGANLVFTSMSEFGAAWKELVPPENVFEEAWNAKCQEIMDYMERFKRRPSKHRVEDHLMLNWIKYNKKMKARGNMPENRIEKFEKLLELANKYRKVNQNAYMHIDERPMLWDEDSQD